ncbi:MAG: single-stranded-DNA-specific exonuclease RecJ [Alphaproteobacteria bacterium]
MSNNETSSAFLGVEKSASRKRWIARDFDERTSLAIAQTRMIPEIFSRVLVNRGVTLETVDTFLNPSLRNELPDPSHLLDMDQAVERVVKAFEKGQKIGIFGDYDVDGATSAALLTRFFSALGRSVEVYIPDRQKEGYGPNLTALKKLKERGVELVITVDCGTTAFEVLENAGSEGLDIIVVDHHVAEPRLPSGALVINPNRLDQDTDHTHLAAVGVTFLFVVAINRALREAFWYGEGHPEPDLRQWLDLVALGTICDVVPLKGLNRAFVRQGLKVMAGRGNLGIRALADVARVDRPLDCYHAGFILGPRVNAGGRVGESGLGVRLLSSNDASETHVIAQKLDGLNKERQEIEQRVFSLALEQAETEIVSNPSILMVEGEGWHPGVIGIVAGRLRERFNLPSCVVAMENGIGKASGRSVSGIALGPAVISALQAGLLVNGGGHSMAAGFSVEASKLGDLKAFLNAHIKRQWEGKEPVLELKLDGALTVSAVSSDLVSLLEGAGPYGSGNPRPRFGFPELRVVQSSVVGNDHIKCIFSDVTGKGRLKGIAFRAVGTEVGEVLLNHRGLCVNIAGSLRQNEWQGKVSNEIFVEDVSFVG